MTSEAKSALDDELVDLLRERARSGATLLELVHLVHDYTQTARYSRGILLYPFHTAFGLSPLDFQTRIFACEIFGDGATASLEDCERAFREHLVRE